MAKKQMAPKKKAAVPASKVDATNPNIVYGEVDLTEEDLNPRNIKHRVTMYLDLDIIEAAKRDEDGRGYQPYLNDKLREAMFGKKRLEYQKSSVVFHTMVGRLSIELDDGEDREKLKAACKAMEAAQDAIYEYFHPTQETTTKKARA